MSRIRSQWASPAKLQSPEDHAQLGDCCAGVTSASMAEMMTPFSLLIATTHRGIERAERSGGDWRVDSGLTEHDVRCLGLSADGVALAGTQGDGVFRSEDGGATWTPSGLQGLIVKSVDFCADDPNVVYAGTKPPTVYRSDDAGQTWRELTSFRDVRGRAMWRQPAERPSTAYVQALAVSPRDPDVVVAGMEAGAVVRTIDGGRSWSNHLKGSCRDCHSLHFHPDGRHVFEGGGGVMAPGYAVSPDRGETWERPGDGLDVKYGWAVAADPQDPQRSYVSMSPSPMKAHSESDAEAAIFRRDGDAAWRNLQGGLPQPLDHMPYAFVTHPATAGYLMAGLANGELWETFDHGDSWSKADLALSAVHRVLVAR